MNVDINKYQQGIVDWIESETGKGASSTEKGTAFCKWCLENIFDLSNEQALDAMEVAGAYDFGIDAFILGEQIGEEQIIVVQTKYESAHDWSEITKFHYDMGRIHDEKVNVDELNDYAARIVANIQDAYDIGWKVSFFYITNCEFTENEALKITQISNEAFHIYDIKEIAQKLETKSQEIPDTIRNKSFPLRLASREILSFEKTAVIAVGLADIHDFVSQAGNELFASNVRQYLRGTKINTGIRSTIQNSPDKFWLYNNGITIVCDDFEEINSSSGFLLRACTES